MNKYLSGLSPLERRFVVGVAVMVFIILNFTFVWPHFGDRAKYNWRLDRARQTIERFQAEIAKTKTYQAQIKSLESDGSTVAEEDQGIDFIRTVQTQAAMSGVNILGNSRQPARTNQFFVEQSQSVNIQATEKALVTFLYNLGEGNSMIRVRGLSLRPDAPRQQLTANITLIASYQKKTPTRGAASSATKRATPTQ